MEKVNIDYEIQVVKMRVIQYQHQLYANIALLLN